LTTVHEHVKDGGSTQAPRNAAAPANTELPEFLRDVMVASRFLDRRLASASPVNIFSEVCNPSRTSTNMANPLMRRSYAALMARPLTTLPGFRSMSTYQPSRLQQFAWIDTQHLFAHSQTRRFGTGGVPRDLLANREAAANRNPNSATAQNSFYQLLLKANMPAIVVERYQSGTL
jgi:ATP-dependent metalloprotease